MQQPPVDRPDFDRPGYNRPGYNRPDYNRPDINRSGFDKRIWSANRVFALLIGLLFLVLAVFGWIFHPTAGTLFGVFHTGTARNVLSSATAVLALLAAFAGNKPARIFNQIFGIVYLAIGILGFIPAFSRGGVLFDFLHVNVGDNLLDIVLGAISLYLGFSVKGLVTSPTT